MKINMSRQWPTISVIIPLYNGEEYIIKCLDSVRGQNYPSAEIVVVNDGSADRSADLVAAYRRKHGTALKLILINQDNQGQGAARNTGINASTGKYLAFLDQDDTLEKGILRKMADKAEATQADIVFCGYRRIAKDGSIKQEVCPSQTEWSKYKIITPWSKLYRSGFIKSNQILFLPVVLGEDIYFLMQAYSFRPRITFLEDIGYNWLDNAASVSNTAHRKLQGATSLIALFNTLDSLEHGDVLKQDKLYEYFLEKTAIWNILYTSRYNPYTAAKKNAAAIWKWFGRHFPGYEKNPYLKINTPIGETWGIRLLIWGYMKLKKCGCENMLLRILCRQR